MNEILDEYKSKKKRTLSLKIVFVFMVAIVFVIVFGIYVGNVLFGERSYIVLKSLQEEKSRLYKDINKLKEENALLHKEYLEKALLDPDIKP